ncbi:nucleoside hydrolase [Corynebacterium lubricantis]|uniref:nucleoside hydrolase n=1 Tax=Corynebacterium lubricantis TaxID=541095 RepID=UPI000379E6C0|nr:nucleoside hydrolase [Corynebacterium lubricantis]
MRTPVVIDCDPGIDDTLALIYLAGLHVGDEISFEAVTTTAGNTTVANTATNAAWVLAQCGLPDIPVAPGCAVPLKVPLTITPETHGPTGLGYVTAATSTSLHDDWQHLWIDAIEKNGTDLHLIVTGPLTNLAQFRRDHPEHYAQLTHVTVMGGAVNYRGNTTPTAEWNFWVDPHAASEVFEHAPCEITLCSLEVTERMLVDPERAGALVDKLGAVPIAQHLQDILRFYFEFHEGNDEGYQAQIHDLLTCMIALVTVDDTELATTVAVEADSELMRGTSVADLRNHWGKPANAHLVMSADIAGAHEELDRAASLLADRARTD